MANTNTNANVNVSGTSSATNTSSDKMGERELITDMLGSEKLLCNTYSTAIIEAATPQVRESFKSVLLDEFDVQNTIFMAMNEKGWYPVDAAQQNKVQQVKEQYPSSVLNA
ncbi:MAG: hypothetical protein A2Y24_02715 [Clostridiales bacterium GWE2_32_10]|nr:MAG: hypothetical protein A2Y24_02715 [Clostridiales bacterium GWE2_32_10]